MDEKKEIFYCIKRRNKNLTAILIYFTFLFLGKNLRKDLRDKNKDTKQSRFTKKKATENRNTSILVQRQKNHTYTHTNY